MADITNINTYRSTKSQPALSGKATTVHCLQIPLHDDTLLLPNAAVAEVIVYSEPEMVSNGPDWLLGRLNWRERRVPLISFEIASNGELASQQGTRIAVLNTLNSNPRVPYIAIITQGIPSMSLIKEDQLSAADAVSSARQSVATELMVEGNKVLVPDLDDLEHRIERLHAT